MGNPDHGQPGNFVYPLSAKALVKRIHQNGKLVTTSLAHMVDDGDTVEYQQQRGKLVDLFDEAIQLWQSHAPYSRAGKWPPDRVINQYVGYVKARRERHERNEST